MKLERMIGILNILLRGDKTTAPELAGRFEVSRRTILRDIDALCAAGIPLVTERGSGGGISVMSGYQVDRSVLTPDELRMLLTGLKGVDSILRVPRSEALIEKLSILQPTESDVVIDLASFYKTELSYKIEVLREAISDLKTVIFDYYYSKGEQSRELDPYRLEFRWGSWYVFGWCHLRQDFRMFKLNRLLNLNVTCYSFERRSVPTSKAEIISKEPTSISVLFDPSVRYRLIESYGSNCYTETDAGLLMELGYDNREWITSWILGFGTKARVVAPLEIVEDFTNIARTLLNMYEFKEYNQSFE